MPARRAFLQSGVSLVAAAAAPLAPSRTLIRPPRLRAGQRMALFNPVDLAATAEDAKVATRTLERLGLVAVRAPSLDVTREVSDQERAAEINELFADRSVHGLIALRGGWGCARLLPHLDYAMAQERPKAVIGFSDIGALLLGLNARAGLVTFHGPTAISEWTPRATAAFRQVLFDGEAATLSRAAGTTVHQGRGRGRLIGGNLTVLCSLVGSPYVPFQDDVLLFLEEVQEPLSEVDRGLTQLDLAGHLDRVRGMVFGRCLRCAAPQLDESMSLRGVLAERVGRAGIPSFHGAPVGHGTGQITVPIGTLAELDAAQQSWRMLEPAVV
jgi:muramoyltetrapeptide carboxypeptidase